MAQIFGTSQSTKALQYQLPTLKGYDFSSWKEIKKFYTHLQKVLEQRIEEITRELEDKKPFKKKDSKHKRRKFKP